MTTLRSTIDHYLVVPVKHVISVIQGKEYCLHCGNELAKDNRTLIPYRGQNTLGRVVSSEGENFISPLCRQCTQLGPEQVIKACFEYVDMLERSHKCSDSTCYAIRTSIIDSVNYLYGVTSEPPFPSKLWGSAKRLQSCDD